MTVTLRLVREIMCGVIPAWRWVDQPAKLPARFPSQTSIVHDDIGDGSYIMFMLGVLFVILISPASSFTVYRCRLAENRRKIGTNTVRRYAFIGTSSLHIDFSKNILSTACCVSKRDASRMLKVFVYTTDTGEQITVVKFVNRTHTFFFFSLFFFGTCNTSVNSKSCVCVCVCVCVRVCVCVCVCVCAVSYTHLTLPTS